MPWTFALIFMVLMGVSVLAYVVLDGLRPRRGHAHARGERGRAVG